MEHSTIVMNSIEAKATVIANKIYSGWDTERIRQIERGAIIAATEQDRIARQEERQRCIEAAQDVYCDITCNRRCDIKNRCQIMYEIRKAIEGGE